MLNMHMQVLTKMACILVVVLSANLNAAFAGDRCSDILANGIKDEYSFSSSNSIEESAYQAVCKRNYNHRSNSSGFAINIPIPELKSLLGVNANDSFSSQRRDEFCNNASSNINRSSAVNFSKTVVSKNVVNAWSACMSSKGLHCDAENINNTHFILKASWHPTSRAEEPEIESDLMVIGGSCDNLTALKSGRQIRQHVPITEACKRDSNNPNGQIYAFLNTTQGSLNCVVPKLVEPLSPNVYLQACVDGNYEGCAGLIIQAREKRQTCLDVVGSALENMSPTEAQNRAALARSCGNIEGNAQAKMALIENLWRDCNQYRSDSEQCNDAKRNLTMNMM